MDVIEHCVEGVPGAHRPAPVDGTDRPGIEPAGRWSIRLGTLVTSVPRRNVAKLASEVSTLDQLWSGSPVEHEARTAR